MMTVNNTILCDENRKLIHFLRAEFEFSSHILNPVPYKVVDHLRPSTTEIDVVCFKRRQSLSISAMPRPSLQYPLVYRYVRSCFNYNHVT
jgi:hypothetical protein